MFPNQKPDQFDLSQFSDEQIMEFIKSNPELKQKYDQFLFQQKKANIQTNQLKTKPLTDSEYLKLKDIQEYLDQEGGMMIEPTPHFVLKAFDQNGEKVFFNVTAHSVVDAPEEKQLIDYNNEVGIRVPMSVGNIKEDHDVKGDTCKVIDLIINPTVATNLTQDDNLKTFFCQLVQTYVDQKYKLKLQDKFISLKMKYKGKSIQFQRVKGKKPPKVQVIDEKPNQSTPQKNNNDDEDETEQIRKRQREEFEKQQISSQPPTFVIQEPEWELYLIYPNMEQEYDGDLDFNAIKQYRFQILTPLLITGKAIKLKVDEDQFQMIAGKFYKISLRFPSKINKASVKALFLTEKRTLWISADVYKQNENADQQGNQQKEEQVNNVQSTSQQSNSNYDLQNNLIFDIV
ncbi:unnamed protein product [Paramecium pentaurelia]|uniref:PIH1 domain-containing protein 1 n=1 Tax=Paramecium pentaurelia TaxID=43138 RepID=A0A8S1WQT1_9CILI|nr:unnamed protein product [Paramecium pentaurelia]